MRIRIKVTGKLVYNDYLLCTPQVDELTELGYFDRQKYRPRFCEEGS
ncbi:hypothetical protein Lani381_0084 [Ligilactobacillus animalis]|uniref:Uncharacterized protein n=1 Tax=Ligilactobacillus animalis TaxID=1605 RepID=A0ABR4RUV1_9LACO|nr:hypothetical protein Lani381_0084 [Ligilactobacillus animalis]